MSQAKRDFPEIPRATVAKFVATAVLLMTSFPLLSFPQQKGQKTFSSPEEASAALIAATQSGNEGALLEIFGPDGKEIVSSGDAAEDAQERTQFIQKYQEMNRLVREPDGTVTLYIGAHNWPTPIPIVNKGSIWFFDTAAGKQEILARRVGLNEMSAIRICQELVAAQKDYRSMQHDEYARKMFSDDGKTDGLYWQVPDGQPQSPIGPLVAEAVAEGYVKGDNSHPTPYRGYYFHILTRQGKDAPGGAKDYVVNGKMTEGFAFIAYPAEYRTSGVMTFLVNQDGLVYEKDLGKKTSEIAQKMKDYDPTSTWHKAALTQEELAAQQNQTDPEHVAPARHAINRPPNPPIQGILIAGWGKTPIHVHTNSVPDTGCSLSLRTSSHAGPCALFFPTTRFANSQTNITPDHVSVHDR